MVKAHGEAELGEEEQLGTGRRLSTITEDRLVWSKVGSRKSSEIEGTLMDRQQCVSSDFFLMYSNNQSMFFGFFWWTGKL